MERLTKQMVEGSDQIRLGQIGTDQIGTSFLENNLREQIAVALQSANINASTHSPKDAAKIISESVNTKSFDALSDQEQAEFLNTIAEVFASVENIKINIDTTLARKSLDAKLSVLQEKNLGIPETLHLQSTMGNGEFLRLPEYIVSYPQILVEVLGELYTEYNNAFAPLIEQNREWDTDYQYCFVNGNPVNYFVQIDMPALPDDFLQEIAEGKWSKDALKNMLRSRIFEFENSLAMYELLNELHSSEGEETEFRKGMKTSLDMLRQKHGKKIAILAVTNQKYTALRETEFGKNEDEILEDEEVLARSGFDMLIGPDEFKTILAENNGECPHLLYVRSSMPTSKLKNPKVMVENPLLGDDAIRKQIKANALTMNVDNPSSGNPKETINDTKEYMGAMGLAFHITSDADMMTEEVIAWLNKGKSLENFEGEILTEPFTQYLQSQGVDAEKVAHGEIHLHVKPMKEAYGCYGHLNGGLSNGKFRRELRSLLKNRGEYVVQMQMPVAQIANNDEQIGDEKAPKTYAAIHRNFYTVDKNGAPIPLNGFINMIPNSSFEAAKGNVHGNREAVWGKVHLQG